MRRGLWPRLSRWLLAALLLAGPWTEAADRLPGTPPGGVGGCPEQRDARGQLKRSTTVRQRFQRLTGHPKGRPGHRVDHIVPLKRGGCDCVTNLQWLTIEEKRAKDRVE